MKKEVLTTFEIREKIEKKPIAFVVKEEVEELERIRMVQKNVDFNGIGFRVCVPKLVQEYISSTQITSIIVGFSNQHSLSNHPAFIVALVINFLLFPHITP